MWIKHLTSRFFSGSWHLNWKLCEIDFWCRHPFIWGLSVCNIWFLIKYWRGLIVITMVWMVQPLCKGLCFMRHVVVAPQSRPTSIVCSTVCSVADQSKTSKLPVTGLCEGISPVTGEFPSQRASSAENITFCWRHPEVFAYQPIVPLWHNRISKNNIFAPKSGGHQGAVSIRKPVLPGMAIPMLKIRRPNGRLIFNMEIAIRR